MQRRRRCAVAEREDKKVCRWCIRAKEAEGEEGGGWWAVVGVVEGAKTDSSAKVTSRQPLPRFENDLFICASANV